MKDKYIQIDEVAKIVGKTEATIYRWQNKKGFPKRGILGYSLNEINQWIAKQYGNHEKAA